MATVHEQIEDVQPGWLADSAEPLDERPYDTDTPELLIDLPTWLNDQASYYRSRNTRLGEWLAGRLDDLADDARCLHAATVDEFDARIDVLERDREERLRDQGYESALGLRGPL